MKCLLVPQSRCWGNCQKYRMFKFAFWWNSCSGLWSVPNCVGTCLSPAPLPQVSQAARASRALTRTERSQDRLGQTDCCSVIRPMSTSQHLTLNTQHTVSWRVRAVSLHSESVVVEEVEVVVKVVEVWEDIIVSHHHSLLVQPCPVLTLSLDNPWQLHPDSAHHKNWWDHIWYFSVLPVVVSPAHSNLLPWHGLSKCGFDIVGWIVCQFSCCTQVVISNKVELFLWTRFCPSS